MIIARSTSTITTPLAPLFLLGFFLPLLNFRCFIYHLHCWFLTNIGPHRKPNNVCYYYRRRHRILRFHCWFPSAWTLNSRDDYYYFFRRRTRTLRPQRRPPLLLPIGIQHHAIFEKLSTALNSVRPPTLHCRPIHQASFPTAPWWTTTTEYQHNYYVFSSASIPVPKAISIHSVVRLPGPVSKLLRETVFREFLREHVCIDIIQSPCYVSTMEYQQIACNSFRLITSPATKVASIYSVVYLPNQWPEPLREYPTTMKMLVRESPLLTSTTSQQSTIPVPKVPFTTTTTQFDYLFLPTMFLFFQRPTRTTSSNLFASNTSWHSATLPVPSSHAFRTFIPTPFVPTRLASDPTVEPTGAPTLGVQSIFSVCNFLSNVSSSPVSERLTLLQCLLLLSEHLHCDSIYYNFLPTFCQPIPVVLPIADHLPVLPSTLTVFSQPFGLPRVLQSLSNLHTL